MKRFVILAAFLGLLLTGFKVYGDDGPFFPPDPFEGDQGFCGSNPNFCGDYPPAPAPAGCGAWDYCNISALPVITEPPQPICTQDGPCSDVVD